jgi:DNA-binding transcriptional regulator YiaG
MGAIDTAIKSEIVRLAKREARKLATPLREELRRLKKRDAERKAEIASLEEKIRKVQAKERLVETTSRAAGGEVKGRLSPRLIKSLRTKLGLSQSGFATLLEVSTLTIGNWEHGKANPRPEMRAKILSFRGMGRREAKAIVANLFQKDKPAAAKAVTGKKAGKSRPGKRRSPRKVRSRKRTK